MIQEESGLAYSDSEDSENEDPEYNMVDSNRNSFAKIKKTTTSFFTFLKKITHKSKSEESSNDTQANEISLQSDKENSPLSQSTSKFKTGSDLESDSKSSIRMSHNSNISSLSSKRRSSSKHKSSFHSNQSDRVALWQPQVSQCLQTLMNIYSRPDEDFVTVKKGKNYILGKIVSKNNPILLVRGRLTLQAEPDKLFQLIHDLNTRSKWEPILLNFEQIEQINDTIDVIYSRVKGVFGVSDRDFVQLRGTFQKKNGFDYLIVMKSVEHSQRPLMKKTVRANTIISGYLIRDIGEGRCELGIISQTDIRGRIPKFLVNIIAPKQPVKWLKKLEKAVVRFEELVNEPEEAQ